MGDDVWAMVHEERAALIADLEGVDAARWDEPSLCPGWSVHDVVAHLVHSARTTRLGFVVAMARAGFDFDRQNAHGVTRERGTTPAQTLDRLRAVARRTSTPPGPRDSRLVEEVVHGEDVRRPLGLRRAYPAEAVGRALRLQVRTPASFGGAKEAATHVRLTATDADLSLGGGPEGSDVRGSALALLLAVSGRPVASGELTGPGVAVLATGR
ncbi:maleylpyruvate isomerase family mycothiol-dependent enzyme [Actinomycetospora sp. CA-101289]|uniref:maleylpyruvate isomerase family mycothiol-dependent enzyme n=1 Tax=Actinomycetospora sp. CA-101289 TaxID=3239893 RepID=UPI003D96D536